MAPESPLTATATAPHWYWFGGALDDGSENAPLARELARHFTVYNYARRGRADSGDTPPYAVAREVGDLGALLAEAGGAAHVYGVSSGGTLALPAPVGSRLRPMDDAPEACAERLRHHIR